MSAASKAARRFRFHLSPAGIALGYLLTLLAVVAGVVVFPFSSTWLCLLFVVIGAFFVVAVPIILASYLVLAIAVYRATMALGCRLLIGSLQDRKWQITAKPFAFQKNNGPGRADNARWDRWIDGLR